MWHFVKYERGHSITGLVGDQDFNEYYKVLREGIQNSVDANMDKENLNNPTKIIITLEQKNRNDIEEFLFLDTDSKWHFKVSNKIPNTKESRIPILKFEDYNTTGILGHIENDESDMFAFLQQEQETSETKKKHTSGGSRGIGKSAFIYASHYHTFFLSTISQDGGMHIGRAYLKPKRKKDHIVYTKEAFFVGSDTDTHPINSLKNADKNLMDTTLGLNRTEYGTSIAIIDPKFPEIRNNFLNETVHSIIENYYFLFIEGSLEITVKDAQGKQETITKDNVFDWLDNFDPDFVQFIKSMYINMNNLEEIIFENKSKDFANFINTITDEKKEKYRHLYHSGKPFKVKFEYEIDKEPISNDNPDDVDIDGVDCADIDFADVDFSDFDFDACLKEKKEHLTFFIQKAKEKATMAHMRRHILSISDSAKNILTKTNNRMFIGLNVQDSTPRTHDALKQCEDNSHTKWQRTDIQNDRLIRMGITRHIPEFLNALLTIKSEDETQNFDVFSDVFPALKGKTSGGGKKPPIPPKEKGNICISEIQGGIKIYNTSEINSDSKICIRLGYVQENTRSEKSIQDYKSYLFDVANMQTDPHGIDIEKCEKNTILLSNPQQKFSFSLTELPKGFDFEIDVQEIKNEIHD